MTNRQLLASQKIKEKYTPKKYLIGDTIGNFIIKDVIVPFDLLEVPYSPDFESRLEYLVRCTLCKQKSIVPFAELLTSRKCAHYTAPAKLLARATRMLTKIPSDSELAQFIAWEGRTRRGRLTEKDARKISRDNPSPFNLTGKR